MTVIPEKATLLIVDDSPESLTVLGGLLQPYYLVRATCSGEQALRAARTVPRPDLILLDVMMPGMDGYEVLRGLREDPLTADIPVIFITALGDEDNEVKGFELGAADYIHKPVEGPIVLSRVKVQLEAKAARDVLRKTNARLTNQVEAGAHALEEAQLQLLHTERLAAIGQLAAGVAHEINNPIGYVGTNLSTLQSDLDELFELIDAYEANPRAVAALRERIDPVFLRREIDELLSESQEGLTQVRQIILGLKDFSRASSPDWQWVNVHGGIETALNMVWHELKYHCKVDKAFGPLPKIHCLPSQLNQVFMNLLINASQAIQSRRANAEPDYKGHIAITTSVRDPDTVTISFADNGCGIETGMCEHIFDPFFTTKPAGEGTGLGLPLSREIIARHHGRIEVNSTPGQGTVFTLLLPVDGQLDRNIGNPNGGIENR